MKVLTYTSYKEHYDLYTEIYGLIAVNSCQIRLAQKDIIFLSSAPIITYKAGKPTDVENWNFYILASQEALIQLTILIQNSRNLSHNKDKTGNHPKLKT